MLVQDRQAKFETITNFQKINFQIPLSPFSKGGRGGISNFHDYHVEFVSDFDIRISDPYG